MKKETKKVECFNTPEEMLKAIIRVSRKDPKACIFLTPSIIEKDFGEGVSLEAIDCGLDIWVRLSTLKTDYGDTEIIFGAKEFPNPKNTYFFNFYN